MLFTAHFALFFGALVGPPPGSAVAGCPPPQHLGDDASGAPPPRELGLRRREASRGIARVAVRSARGASSTGQIWGYHWTDMDQYAGMPQSEYLSIAKRVEERLPRVPAVAGFKLKPRRRTGQE